MAIGDDRGWKRTEQEARKDGGPRSAGTWTAGAWAAFGMTAVFVALMSVGLVPVCGAAQSRSEQQLIEALASGASLQEKDAACAELKRVGTVRSVLVLAGFLADPDLSHSARYALESMPDAEAGAALVQALDKTSGMVRAGIIHSLGLRREAMAVPSLDRLLHDPDPGTASAAALALGRIGGSVAIRSLLGALPGAEDPVRRDAILDAVLQAANRELEEGRRASAAAVFGQVVPMSVPDHIRAAAYRGLIASADENRALGLIKTAIQGANKPAQTAALDMARELKAPGLTSLLCGSLGAAAPPMKVALIEALRQRGDPAAAPSLAALVKAPDNAVHPAAIAGLGELGDGTAVNVLLEAAASSDEAEMRAGRQALLVLRRGDVMHALLGNLTTGRPPVRVAAAHALAGRGDKDAVPALAAAARGSLGPVRAALFSSLGQLADGRDIPALVAFVVEATDDPSRDEARDALGAACARLSGESAAAAATAVVNGLAGAGPQARGALLQAGSVLLDERLRAELRRALADPDPGLRRAASMALYETRDPGLLPDLLNYARQASEPGQRVPAVRGYVRLVSDTENVKLTVAERVKAFEEILPIARNEEKWAVLAGLAKWPDIEALTLSLSMLDDPATRAEAAQAVTSIAAGLAPTRREHARMALESVLASVPESDQRQAALAALRQIDANAGAPTPVVFRRVKVDGAFRSEGVAVADFNKDGHLDIATGNILYLGPDWKPQPMLAAAKEYAPENYSDEFLCFAEDLDRDGWLDLIVVGFPGAKTRWLRNPGLRGGPWKEFLAVEKTGNESPAWVDVFKDGRKELVFLSEQGMALARPGADPAKPWPIRVIAGPGDPRPGHGLGVGDINGDGRNDIICPDGWWEGPADPSRIPWTFHRAKLGFEAPAQMVVFDVNGDGRADVVSSGAHRYGLWWYEQTADGGWIPHEIDHGISQLHALHLADINGDGLPDLVTGKRFWAHREGDDGIDDPAVLCWFEMKREAGKPFWVRRDIDFATGVGLHFAIVDINGDGLLDIVTSNKKGVYVFLQERK